jgi:hypothetical protein
MTYNVPPHTHSQFNPVYLLKYKSLHSSKVKVIALFVSLCCFLEDSPSTKASFKYIKHLFKNYLLQSLT